MYTVLLNQVNITLFDIRICVFIVYYRLTDLIVTTLEDSFVFEHQFKNLLSGQQVRCTVGLHVHCTCRPYIGIIQIRIILPICGLYNCI